MSNRRNIAMNQPSPRPQGFSLVELMIALAAGLVVSSAVVAFLMSSFKSNSDYVISTRLTQDLRNTLDLVSRDLRRAGYSEDAMTAMGAGASGVTNFSRLQLCDAANVCTGVGTPTPPDTCAIYAYDRIGGTAGVLEASNGEVRGVRRKTRTNINGASVGVIEYAVSTTTAGKPTCVGAGPNYNVFPTVCNTATGWCPLTDATKLDITSFTLTDGGSNAGGVMLRAITVVVQGRPAGTTEYIRGVQSSVRIRSDCYDSSLANCSLSP